MGDGGEEERKVDGLVGMGLSRLQAIKAIRRAGGDVAAAVVLLLRGDVA